MSEIEPENDERGRGLENAVLVVGFIALVAVGVWLLVAMADVRKAQDCAGQGRRNCATIDMPARSP